MPTMTEYREKAEKAYKDGQELLAKYPAGKDVPEEHAKAVDQFFDDAERFMRFVHLDHREKQLKEMVDGVFSRPAIFPGDGGFHVPDSRPEWVKSLPKKFKKEQIEAEVKYADSFDSFLHAAKEANLSPADVKTLSSRSDPDGGYIVMHEFRNQMITKLRDLVHMRKLATVISTSAASIGFPSFDYDGSVPDLQENDTITEENLGDLFGKVSFTPHKRARIFRVPQELVDDGMFDIGPFLTTHFAMRFAEIEEADFINGNGVNKPLGFLAAGLPTLNNATASSNAITAEDILNLVYSIRAVYRNSPGIGFKAYRDTIKAIRKLRTGTLDSTNVATFTTGDFLWQPSFQAGEPPRLAGYPLLESEFYPTQAAATAAGDPLITFADFSHYWIVDRNNLAVKRLDELYAANDQIGYRLTKRTDGAPVLRDPFMTLVRQS